jgi:hypothetical protein
MPFCVLHTVLLLYFVSGAQASGRRPHCRDVKYSNSMVTANRGKLDGAVCKAPEFDSLDGCSMTFLCTSLPYLNTYAVHVCFQELVSAESNAAHTTLLKSIEAHQLRPSFC